MKQRGMCCANNNCYHLLMNSFSLCWGSQKMKLLLLEEKYLELLEEGETLSALQLSPPWDSPTCCSLPWEESTRLDKVCWHSLTHLLLSFIISLPTAMWCVRAEGSSTSCQDGRVSSCGQGQHDWSVTAVSSSDSCTLQEGVTDVSTVHHQTVCTCLSDTPLL